MAYIGTTALERTPAEIRADVVRLSSTAEWLSFYLAEAHRVRDSERSSLSSAPLYNVMQERRLFHLARYAFAAIEAQMRHLTKHDTYDNARILSALVGLTPIPWLKISTRSKGAKKFGDVAIRRLGLADSSNVESLRREAHAKAGAISSISDYLKECGKIIGNELGRELLSEVWHNGDLHQLLLEELGHEIGREATTSVVEHAVHIKPIVGQLAGSFLGWHATTKKLDKTLGFLGDAALEFHQKIFIPVVVARVFPPPPILSAPIHVPKAPRDLHGGTRRREIRPAAVASEPVRKAAVTEPVRRAAVVTPKAKTNDALTCLIVVIFCVVITLFILFLAPSVPSAGSD